MKRTWKRIGSLFLAFCMVFTMLPGVAFAETGDVDSGMSLEASGTITAFTELSAETVAQSVYTGTTKDELILPKELTATITESGGDVTTGSDASKETQTTVAVDRWTADPEYDGDAEGVYTFTPALDLPDSITIAKGVTPPAITVTVGKEAAAPVVRGGMVHMGGGITTSTELKEALENNTPATITVTADITLTDETIMTGAAHTLMIDSGKTLTIKNSATFAVMGNFTVSGSGTLKVENSENNSSGILVLLGNTVISGVSIVVSNSGMASSGIAVSTSLTIDNSQVTISNSDNGSIGIFGSAAGAEIRFINGSHVTLSPSMGSGIHFIMTDPSTPNSVFVDNSILDFQSGLGLSLSDASAVFTGANGGMIRLTQGAGIHNVNDKLSDQGYVLTAANSITVGAAGAAPSATGLTAGDYVWDGTYFTKSGTSSVDAQTPNITGQPVGATYTQGEATTPLTVTAEVADGGALSYQWYYNGANSTYYTGMILGGATGSSHTPGTAFVGISYYYCTVTNTNVSVSGEQIARTNSNIVRVAVIPSGSVPLPVPTPPTWSAQPDGKLKVEWGLVDHASGYQVKMFKNSAQIALIEISSKPSLTHRQPREAIPLRWRL